ncbi:MAG: aminotransferase class V-fold PLP-dependent enzyme, partial [Acidobacteriota bacterium]
MITSRSDGTVALMRRIYLDHNATSPPLEVARQALEKVCRLTWGNPSSPHAEGRQARQVMDRARQEVAHLAGVPPGWILFT